MGDLDAHTKLPAFQLLAGLVRKWWGLALTVADAQSPMFSQDGCVAPHELCQASLFSRRGFGRCSESLDSVRSELRQIASTSAGARRRVFVTRCHLGFDVAAAPILRGDEFVGVVYVEGGVRGEPTLVARDAWARELRGFGADVPFDPEKAAVPVVRAGDWERLLELLEFAARELSAEVLAQGAAPRQKEPSVAGGSFARIIGDSPPMRELFGLLAKIVRSDSTVLITGESGTGKELVARAIRDGGARKDKPFVVQNCSAFNDNLLESALFGHAKGSFTGAIRDKKGLFEVADGGTFFLDEIGDMSPALQVKLLRVLQEGTLTPVGSTEVKHVDVRVIAATHKNLSELVARGGFREDLYYRINVIQVVLPNLRDRMQDLPRLVAHFLRKHSRGGDARFSEEAMERMRRYAWPGNIRELENEVERVLVLGADENLLPVELLSPRIREATAVDASAEKDKRRVPAVGTLKEAIEDLEREMIRQGLLRTRYNKSKLAKRLGISRSNLIQKCLQYGLDRKG